MARLKGINVTLKTRIRDGTDQLGQHIYKYEEKVVMNVLISPTKSEEKLSTLNLTGRTAVYTLGIPKGDNNEWENNSVYFFGKWWRVFGTPLEGIEELIPLSWNKKVMVERYD